jgi:hypothetical protein
MMHDTEIVPAPQVPAPATLADARFTIRSASGRLSLTFCPLNHVGAVFDSGTRTWSTWSPVAFQTFVQILAGNRIRIDHENQDFELWAETCKSADMRTAGRAS